MFTRGNHRQAEELLADINRGCILGIDPKHPPHDLSQKPAHWFRSYREAAFILDTILKEARAAILIPSEARPLYFINFFTVPKKATDGTMSALRAIRNGSYKAVGKYAVNEFISDEFWRITTLPKLTTYAHVLVDKEYLALRDLSDAFRQLILAVSDQKYCGYSIFGQWWLDTRVAYGLSSSAASCQRFVELICTIFNKVSISRRFKRKGAPDIRNCYGQILAYIDDFMMAAKKGEESVEMEHRFDALLVKLNVKQSLSKKVRTCTKAVVFGWEWDLAAIPKTVAIPWPKFIELRVLVLSCIACRIVTMQVLKKLNGKLMHYSQIRREAKALLWNITQAIARFCKRHGHRNNGVALLTPLIIRCLRMWFLCSSAFRTATIASLLYRPSIDIAAMTDASSHSGGYMIGDHWAHYRFRADMARLPICAKEAHAIIVMLHTLKHELTGRCIHIACDNANVVRAVVRRWSKSPMLMTFVIELIMCLLKYKITIWIEWISTHRNGFADALSRGRITGYNGFKHLCKIFGLQHRDSPDAIVYPTAQQLSFPRVTREEDAREYQRFQRWAASRSPTRGPRWWCRDLDGPIRGFALRPKP